MPTIGRIYILINPVMPGLLKIGKTCRTSDARAQELSGDTGVPASFVVAYEAPVSDCDAAECEVHGKLKDYRVNQNREFFKLELRDAIQMVSEIAAKFPINSLNGSSTPGQYGHSMHSPSKDGLTALHRACLGNEVDTVSTLLAAGANPNSKTEDGITPLMVAARKGHSKIVDLLLCAGAKPDTAAVDGSTAASIAKDRGHVFVLNVLNYHQRLHGNSNSFESVPRYRVISKNGDELIHACECKNATQVETLLRQGVNPNGRNASGDAAIDVAARCGATKIVKLLLSRGVRSQKAAKLAEDNGHFLLAELLRRTEASDSH